MNNSWVCIDSNAVTYLLEAMATGKQPIDNLAAEKISLLRTYLYRDGTFCISPTVRAEYSKIRDDVRRKYHTDLGDFLLDDTVKPDSRVLEIRTSELARFHRGRRKLNDCRIVAEAELGGCKCLLTFDESLLKNLKCHTRGINLSTPSAFWSSLKVPQGSSPVKCPRPTNPLSKESWWIW